MENSTCFKYLLYCTFNNKILTQYIGNTIKQNI